MNTFPCCGMPNDTPFKDHYDYHLTQGLGPIDPEAVAEAIPDRLFKIFAEQESFQHNFYLPFALKEQEKVQLSKEYILSAIRELGEVLNVMPWKSHRKYVAETNVEELREELVDVIKFVLNLCIIWGISPEMFYNDFFAKSQKVRERLEAEKTHVKTIS